MTNRYTPKNSGKSIQIDSELEWKYTYFEDSRKWFAFCENLGIAIQSESLEDLKQDMNESVDCLFRNLADSGDLEAFLHNLGWESRKPVSKQARFSSVDMSMRFKRVEEHDLQKAVC